MQHEEAVLEDEEAKHIERMMTTTRDVATDTMEKKVVIFERETNKKDDETMTKTTPKTRLSFSFNGGIIWCLTTRKRTVV